MSDDQEGVWFGHLIRRRALKQRIVEVVARAQEKSPPGTGALIVGSRLRNFVRSFDAIETSQLREMLDAIEAAFELGKFASMVDIVTEKKVGRANAKLARAEKAKLPREPNLVREAVRAALRANPRITSGPESVRKIQAEVTKALDRTKPVTISTLQKYVKEDRRDRKIDTSY